MGYPLFDSGYTLWAADLDAALMDTHGVSIRTIGIEPRQLLDRYYRGVSVRAALDSISQRYNLGR